MSGFLGDSWIARVYVIVDFQPVLTFESRFPGSRADAVRSAHALCKAHAFEGPHFFTVRKSRK